MTIEDKIKALPKMSFDTDNYAAMARVELLREALQEMVNRCPECRGNGYIYGKDAFHAFDTFPCFVCADARAVLEATADSASPRLKEQRERLARIEGGDFFDARCGNCYCDASPASLRACAQRMIAAAKTVAGGME